MTEQEARQILFLHRPGSPDGGDPEIAEALALLRRSPELQAWYEQHWATQAAISAAFKKIAIPEGLKEQILSERKAHTGGFLPRTPAGLAAAVAVLVAIIAVAVYVAGPEWNSFDQRSFASYRTHMVFTALENYRMDVETNDINAVRSYLAAQHAVADWTLPGGLSPANLTGCGVVHWHGGNASMVCFHLGKGAPAAGSTDTWLFVSDEHDTHRSPESGEPVFAKISNLTTASWTEGGKTYLLAVQGDEQYLRSLLQSAPRG